MNSHSPINHPILSERYFFPRRDILRDPFIVSAPGGKLACHYERKHPDGMTLVHFHGNGEIVSDWMDEGFLSTIHGMGCNLFLAEYRGYGMSEGTPSMGGVLEDTAAIIEATGVPPSGIVLFGRSVGSIPAIQGVSLFPEIGGLILESGIASVIERILARLDPSELGVSEKELERSVLSAMDHERALKAYRGPVLVMHTLHDHLVDVSHGKRLHEWAGSTRKKLVVFEQGDHNSILFANEKRYFAEMRSFLGSLGAEM